MNPYDPLNSEKSVEAVLLNVFYMAFPAPLFKKKISRNSSKYVVCDSLNSLIYVYYWC